MCKSELAKRKKKIRVASLTVLEVEFTYVWILVNVFHDIVYLYDSSDDMCSTVSFVMQTGTVLVWQNTFMSEPK